MSKHLNVSIDDKSHAWLNRVRREMMLENGENIPLSKILFLSLVEFRRNNDNQEIKKKLIQYKRLGKTGLEGVIYDIGDD